MTNRTSWAKTRLKEFFAGTDATPMLATTLTPRRLKRKRHHWRRLASGRRDYNYFRDYEPGTGRYVESDPIGLRGGVSTYAYVRSSPLNAIDPLGLEGHGSWTLPEEEVQCGKDQRCATEAFRRNYADMRAANWVNSDKYFHCKANCEATQCGKCGYNWACGISDFREAFDQNVKGDPALASALDQYANEYGRSGAQKNPSISCSITCSAFRPSGLPPQY